MFPPELVLGSVNYARQKEGQYINIASTIDTPDLLIVQNSNLFPNNGKEATITTKFDYTKNSSVPGGPDVRLQQWVTTKFIPGQFTQAEIEARWAQQVLFLTGATWTRLLRAEI